MNPKYRIEFLNEAVEFLNGLDEKAREKIYYNLKKSQITNDNTLFKKLNDEIWEFRTLYKQTQYRLFVFFG
jgi:mRNA-degrading endonuclease RelE of RelBE toxin-antitoxin system